MLIALSGLLVVTILFSPEYGGGANVSDGGGGEKELSRASSSSLQTNKVIIKRASENMLEPLAINV